MLLFCSKIGNVAAVMLLLLLPSIASSQETIQMIPDVLILIEAKFDASNLVAVTYNKEVSKEAAEQDFQRLVQITGWQTSKPKITNESVMENGEKPMTAVEFTASQVADNATGYLPLAKVVTAYKTYENLDIIFLTSPDFLYMGVGDYEDEFVKIQLRVDSGTYRFSVNVKNSDFEELLLAVPNATEQKPENNDGREPKALIVIVLSVILAIAVAVLTYLIVDASLKKRRRR